MFNKHLFYGGQLLKMPGAKKEKEKKKSMMEAYKNECTQICTLTWSQSL